MNPLVRTRPRPLRPADFAADEGHVAYRGLIFRAGEYKAKGFAMTPAELAQAAKDFKPCPVDLGHPSAGSPLDGAMGQLTEVELSGDGTALYGRIEIPKWLDQQLGPAARKVSSSWDRATKRMRRLSLVTNPAIPDAELFAAFAAHSECQCDTKPKEARAMPSKLDEMEEYVKACRAAGRDDLDDEEASMILFPDAGGDDGGGAEEAGGGLGGGGADFAHDVDGLRAENDDLRARVERMEREAIQAKAAEFATAHIAAKRALPKERPRMEREYTRAALDDRRDPIDFAGGTVSRVAELAETYAARRPNALYDDAVASSTAALAPGHRVLGVAGPRGDADFAEEAVDEDTAYARRVNAKYLGRDRIAGNGPPAH